MSDPILEEMIYQMLEPYRGDASVGAPLREITVYTGAPYQRVSDTLLSMERRGIVERWRRGTSSSQIWWFRAPGADLARERPKGLPRIGHFTR